MSYELFLRVPRETTAQELSRLRNELQERLGRCEVLSRGDDAAARGDGFRDACSVGVPGRTTPEEMAALFAMLKDLARQRGWRLFDPQARREIELESKQEYPPAW